MTTNLEDRLNQILPKITSSEFLAADGLGNEIPYFIFEYPPEEELRICKHIDFLLEHIPKHKPILRVDHVNLFTFIVSHLNERNKLDKAIEMEKKKGQEHLQKQLEKILHPQKIAPHLAELMPPDKTDLALMSGIGSAWPFMRASGVLNNLHKFTGMMPLVMFYPGVYDQVTFRLFGKIRDKQKQDNYYRAFRLIP